MRYMSVALIGILLFIGLVGWSEKEKYQEAEKQLVALQNAAIEYERLTKKPVTELKELLLIPISHRDYYSPIMDKIAKRNGLDPWGNLYILDIDKKVIKSQKSEELSLIYDVEAIVRKIASRYEIDPNIILAMIDYNVSGKFPEGTGSVGVMKIPNAWENQKLSRNTLEGNIEIGVDHFKTLLWRTNGDISLALAAYCAGETYASNGSAIEHPEVKQYVLTVMGTKKNVQSLEIEPKTKE